MYMYTDIYIYIYIIIIIIINLYHLYPQSHCLSSFYRSYKCNFQVVLDNPMSKSLVFRQAMQWLLWAMMISRNASSWPSRAGDGCFFFPCCLMLKQQTTVSELPATWRQSTDLWTTSDFIYHIWGAQFLGRRLGRQGLLLHALCLDHPGELGPWLLGHQLDWRLQGGCSQEEVNGRVTGRLKWRRDGRPRRGCLYERMARPQQLATGHVEVPGFRPKGAGRRPSHSWKLELLLALWFLWHGSARAKKEWR